MAKSEILMWVAGIMMMIILGLAVGPTITKSGNTAKTAVINNEISAIKNAAILWVGQNSSDGTYAGITAAGIQEFLPSLALDTGKLVSKTSNSVKYAISVNAGLQIIITGLNTVEGSEASVASSQLKVASTLTNASPADGEMTLVFN